MTELESLLAAVIAEPDSDAARLVYADALEEAAGAGRSKRANTAGVEPLPISAGMRLHAAIAAVSGLPMGPTDCALPMLYAAEKKLEVDAFVVYTDNETYFGNIHPAQALKQYRDKMGRPAKLIVVGMTATPFTIADLNDAGSMDVVGMSVDCPAVMSDFIRN